MIQCNGCGFGVNESMRFALMKNICPSCGSGLFSSKDSSIINLIQSSLKSERFSSSLTESQIYDISLFFFSEIKNGFVKQIFSDFRQGSGLDSDEVSHTESEVDDIRREVEAELADKLGDLDDSGDLVSEDSLSKADRLKKMHQQRVLSNPNLGKEAPINPGRRGGFKGALKVNLMIRAIANQKLDLTKDEFEYYQELEKSFGREGFYGLFRSDNDGQITAITPSPSQPTAMLLVFFLLNVMHNQRLRKLDSWVEKVEGIDARIRKLEETIFSKK